MTNSCRGSNTNFIYSVFERRQWLTCHAVFHNFIDMTKNGITQIWPCLVYYLKQEKDPPPNKKKLKTKKNARVQPLWYFGVVLDKNVVSPALKV